MKDEIRQLLKTPFVARLSVIDDSGFPHTVPLWFDVDGEDIVMISDRNSRKVDFLGVNSKSSICIGGGEDEKGAITTGYLFKGDSTLEEDPGFEWLRRVTYRYESGAAAEKSIELWQRTLDMMVIRLKVTKTIRIY